MYSLPVILPRLAIVITICLVCSCAQFENSTKNLGKGYTYNVSGGDKWIGRDNVMKDGIYPDIDEFAYNNDYIVAIQKPTEKGYKRFLSQDLRDRYSMVLYNVDTTLNDVYVNKFMWSRLWTDKNIHARVAKNVLPDKVNFENINLIADSIIKNDRQYKQLFASKYYYWIIVKTDDYIFGPLSKQQYLSYRQELNIPDSLALKLVN